MANLSDILPLSLLAFALLIRWLVAQFPHSGQNKPPLFGDYEAQRHWMEITTNLPAKDWYRNTSDNDLLYWGLDYPPLTAYHMYIVGYASNKLFNSSWTELHQSRGIETYEHKIFMRSTVILADLLIYMPGIIYYFYFTQPSHYDSPPSKVHKQNVVTYTALVLLYPAQILIDHGHFQYNCVFMGLVLWAAIFLSRGKQATAALLFTFALCYKQMSLYYSLPFFWLIASSNLRVKPFWKGVRNIFLIGFVVVSTFAIIFLPYSRNMDSLLQVTRRIFPFYRGIFEDKVASLWFCLSIFYKYRKLYSMNDLLKASTILTMLASLPSGIHLFFSPTIRNFKYALINTSMVFFLLSFQVHEKTILVPALAILLLFREHPTIVNWFVIISTFSLQPLLIKDGQALPYFVLMTTYTLISSECFKEHLSPSLDRFITIRNFGIVFYITSILGCFVLSIMALILKPPIRYPDIHPTVNALYSCTHFVGFLIFFYYRQFSPGSRRTSQVERVCLIKKTK